MLFLLFEIGDDRYAVETTQIVEVLPMLNVKTVPQAPHGVTGIVNYHGVPVPLIDLRLLAVGSPSRARMTTRIVLVNYVDDAGLEHLLGVMAEGITETMRRAESDFADSGVVVKGAPYLGPVTTDDLGMVQWIQVKQLLPANILGALFQQLSGSDHFGRGIEAQLLQQ